MHLAATRVARVAVLAAVAAGVMVAMRQPPAVAQEGAMRLLITEVYYDTPGRDEDEEWIELANLGPAALDLGGYSLGDEEARGGGEGMARFPAGLMLEPGGVMVVAQTASAFRALFGANPQAEFRATDPGVPDMTADPGWAWGTVGLANDGDEVLLVDASGLIVDALVYGPGGAGISAAFAGPAAEETRRGESLERRPAGCDTNTAADWQVQAAPNPGSVWLEGACREPAAGMAANILPIGQVQGSGPSSPLANQWVTVRGVVTAVVEDQNVAGVRYYTFFVQELPEAADGKPETSDGMPVFAGVRRPNLVAGDLVTVSGRVQEFYGLTELDDNGLQIALEARNQPLPEPIVLPEPADIEAWLEALERHEGMRVAWPEAIVVGATHAGCGFSVGPAELIEARPVVHAADEATGPILGVAHLTDLDCSGFPMVGTGDRVEPLEGPLTYRFEQYTMVYAPETDEVQVWAAPRDWPGQLDEPAAGEIGVASFNVQDYFDGPEAAVKQAKLVHAIGETLGCPTLVGVQEVANRALLDRLAAALAEPCGFTYEATLVDGPDERGIDVGLLSHPENASVTGVAAHQGCTAEASMVRDPAATCPVGQAPLFGRPPLQVDLLVRNEPVTVLVNHFKSKREGEAETEPIRLAEARFVRQLVEELVAARPGTAVIALGDFNDFDRSKVADILRDGGLLVPVLDQVPERERYSYVFSGRAQLLDWILVTPGLADRLSRAAIAHINADFPFSLAADISAMALPFRSSDHDVPLAIFRLAGEPNEAATVTATAVPREVTAETAADPERAGKSAWPAVASALLVAGLAMAVVVAWSGRRRPGH